MRLEVKNITKTFEEKEVLKGVSFQAKSGKALGLLGRNGAGKTTTIRILMDVFHANSGEILLDGKPFQPNKVQIGYLPEERGLYPKRVVSEQLTYLARLRGCSKKKAMEQTDKWLQRLRVASYANVKLETLSKGNQQKVQLASTLVADPDIVILDEPFSGLDPVNSQILQDVVRELIEEGKIVIFSSHQMSYVEQFCEDIIIINHGEVILDGNLNTIKKEFGKDQLVVSDQNMDVDTFAKQLDSVNEHVKVTGQTKEDVIVKLDGCTRKEFFSMLAAKDNFEIEHFDTYKPSLNDIFVKVETESEVDNGNIVGTLEDDDNQQQEVMK